MVKALIESSPDHFIDATEATFNDTRRAALEEVRDALRESNFAHIPARTHVGDKPLLESGVSIAELDQIADKAQEAALLRGITEAEIRQVSDEVLEEIQETFSFLD